MRHNASTEFVFHLLSGTNSERCKKRADTAECFGRAKVLGYTFDPEKKRCERLFHGGCDWLANLYTERKDCEGECKGKVNKLHVRTLLKNSIYLNPLGYPEQAYASIREPRIVHRSSVSTCDWHT